jgi:hypothetical protein
MKTNHKIVLKRKKFVYTRMDFEKANLFFKSFQW